MKNTPFHIAIQGIGVVGGFGSGIDALMKAVERGPVEPGHVTIEMNRETIRMPVFLANTQPLESYIPKRDLRRVDHYTKMALLACHMALEDGGALHSRPQRMGIVVATGYGAAQTTFSFLDSFMDSGDACASPIKFSNSIHNAAAAHISFFLKESGPSLSVSQFEMSFPSALLTACLWLEEKRVDAVLVGGVDEYCRVLGYCWHRLCTHRDTDERDARDTDEWDKRKVLGEGSAFFLLSKTPEDSYKYGYIRNVMTGMVDSCPMLIPDDALIVIGADGYCAGMESYTQYLAANQDYACFTHLYGSLPVGMAFDMAISAALLKNKEERKGSDQPPEWICCLKLDSNREFGLITMKH